MKTCKILSLLLALILSVGILAACGPQEEKNTNNEILGNTSEEIVKSSTTTSDITDSDTETSETESSSETDFIPEGIEDYEKDYREIPDDMLIEEDIIHVILQPSHSSEIYTKEYFSDVGCIEILGVGFYSSRVSIAPYTRGYWIRLDKKSRQNVIDMIALLMERDDVYSAGPSRIYFASDAPTDTSHLASTTSTTEPWEIAKMNLTGAWGITKGSSAVTVGIIDTGIDIRHPALTGRVNTDLSYDFTGAHPGGVDDLDYWHGTAVAGIVGGTWINGGIKGVAPNVQLVSLNVGTGNTSILPGRETINSHAVSLAVLYAEQQGIDILNISINGIGQDADLYREIENFSGLVVCSAGNDNVDCDTTYYHPTSFELPNLITVGASTRNDGHWLYYDDNNELKGSNYGDTTVDLYAPGVDIKFCRLSTDTNIYDTRPGTSYAAPYVAGVAALILSANPGMSPVTIKSCILNNADDISALSSRCESGARLNAYNAVSASHPDHYYSTVDNVSHIAYCACGAYIWVHNYTSRYQAINALNHYAYCSCGAYRTQAHTYVASGANQVCTKCNYLYLINKTDPELETE